MKKNNNEKLTHSELVEIGYKWLLRHCNCGFAFKEIQAFTQHGEIPDVIGFRYDCSILLEAKTSTADFKADMNKKFRQFPELGIGKHRFYICEQGLIKKEELPEGWGLIYVNKKKRTRVIVKPYEGNLYLIGNFPEYNIEDERTMMYSALRRIHLRNHMDDIYKGVKD